VQIKEHHGTGNVTIQWEKLNGSELQSDLSRVIIIASYIIYFCYCTYLCDACCVINVSAIHFQDVGKTAEICKLRHTISKWFAVLNAAWIILSSKFLDVCVLIIWIITVHHYSDHPHTPTNAQNLYKITYDPCKWTLLHIWVINTHPQREW
jgi:hypothetical protein